MELKEFIKTAISDITNAVSELQKELDNGAIVSPSRHIPIKDKTIREGNYHKFVSDIDFDVAITISNVDSIHGQAKAGIQILSAKINGDNESKTENASRMTFSVPVIFPTLDIDKGDDTNPITGDQLSSILGKSPV